LSGAAGKFVGVETFKAASRDASREVKRFRFAFNIATGA
jgi:hypothetical protein